MTPQTTPRIGGTFHLHAPETAETRMRLTPHPDRYRGGWTNQNHIKPTHPVDIAWMREQKKTRAA